MSGVMATGNLPQKLDPERVQELREDFYLRGLGLRELGRKYGVTKALVGWIVDGVRWKTCLTDEDRKLIGQMSLKVLTPIKLKFLRISLRFTQEEFSRQLGVGRVYVVRWESGSKQPTHEERRKLAELARLNNINLSLPVKWDKALLARGDKTLKSLNRRSKNGKEFKPTPGLGVVQAAIERLDRKGEGKVEVIDVSTKVGERVSEEKALAVRSRLDSVFRGRL